MPENKTEEKEREDRVQIYAIGCVSSFTATQTEQVFVLTIYSLHFTRDDQLLHWERHSFLEFIVVTQVENNHRGERGIRSMGVKIRGLSEYI